jgi:hypothetical protein
MDEQLPVLKDFKAEAEPPEPPEPWWKRGFAYAFFTVALAVFFMGDCVYQNISGSRHHWRLSDGWLTIDVVASGILGLVVGVGVCVGYEMRQRAGRSDSAKSPM